uniref:LSM domain-containing protein n=1 Tax=viral metagenome TaxID=1070528 RepID=A0A6C0BP52_9ZZZZ
MFDEELFVAQMRLKGKVAMMTLHDGQVFTGIFASYEWFVNYLQLSTAERLTGHEEDFGIYDAQNGQFHMFPSKHIQRVEEVQDKQQEKKPRRKSRRSKRAR